jgi:hypothetical protein
MQKDTVGHETENRPRELQKVVGVDHDEPFQTAATPTPPPSGQIAPFPCPTAAQNPAVGHDTEVK